MILDCEPALTLLQSTTPPDDRWRLWKKARKIIGQLKQRHCSIRWIWVPSHGKVKAKFVPPDDIAEETLRALNNEADTLATTHLEMAMTQSGRGQWHISQDAANAWSKSVLSMAGEIGERFMGRSQLM